MLGLRREKQDQPPNSPEQRTFLEQEMRIRALERIVKQLDYDLQDAVDGFYRRRQSDRMREVRKEDEVEKKKTRPTINDVVMRALQLSGDRKDEADDSHAKRD
jgi:hypothetical protein